MSNIKNAIINSVREKVALSVADGGEFYERPVSATVGRLTSPLQALILGSTAPLGRSARASDPELQAVISALKDDPGLEDTRVNLGGGHPLDNLSRVWSNDKTGILGKLLGTLASPITDAETALMRSDHYNPFADSVTIYNSDPAILRHELGHARDFSETNYPTAYAYARRLPGVDLYQEAKASGYAGDDVAKLLTEATNSGDAEAIQAAIDDANRTNRVLGGGIGSYVGAPVGGVAGAVLGAKYLPEIIKRMPELKAKLPAHGHGNLGKQVGSVGGAVLGALMGQLIGRYAVPFMTGESREAYDQAQVAL